MTLLSIGILQPVTNLQYIREGNQYNISWSAPFSLDVPNHDPDITYCFDVYDTYLSVPIIKKCNMSHTFFLLSNGTRCTQYRVNIIAVNPAGNSISSSLTILQNGNYSPSYIKFLSC